MKRTTYLKAAIILMLITQQIEAMADTFGGAIAVDDQIVVIENADATTIDIFANDTINKGDVVTIFTQPINGVVNLELFGMSYQPNSNYCNNGTITDDFTYTLTGGSTATVFVTVTCVTGTPGGLIPQVVPVNQFQWLLLLFLTIVIVVKIRKSDLGLI